VAYHEAFWAIVGGAAPVFGLTSAVACGPAAATLMRVSTPIVVRGRRRFSRHFTSPVGWLYAIASLGFVIDLIVFWYALASLANERDYNLGFNATLIGFAFLLLFAQVIAGVGTTLAQPGNSDPATSDQG
jgi:hypothetical protein